MLEVVESSINGGFSQLQSCGDSSEEELSVLPRHTKVVVIGNNRTKSVLVGLKGVVKKAVGLGGWHWLVILLIITLLFEKRGFGVEFLLFLIGIIMWFLIFNLLVSCVRLKLFLAMWLNFVVLSFDFYQYAVTFSIISSF